jgi:hypothetical protein
MTLVFAAASYGQAPQVMAVGSSGVFPTVGIAAVSADPITSAAAFCGTNFWSGQKSFDPTPSNLASGIDGRLDGATQVPAEPGTLWVAWDNDTTPTKVCSYLSVDSIVGQRLFFSNATGAGGNFTGNATLSVSALAKESVGANKVSFVKDNAVCTAGASPASATVLSIVDGAGTATFTATAALAANFAAGASVTISGTTNYNGTFTIQSTTAPAGTSFTFAHAAAATENVGTGNVAANCPGIPPAVYALINNAHFNIAFTDVRPEDAQYAYHRAACALIPGDNTKACMGYGPEGHIGTAILSSYSTAKSQVVAYSISGTDPLSGLAVAPFTTTPFGGVPLVVFVNTSDATAGGLGNAAFTNVPSQVLSNYYTGFDGSTADMNPSVGGFLSGKQIQVVEREVLSGTYNAFEFSTVRTISDNRVRSQETGNTGFGNNCFTPPAAPVSCGNPMWVPGADATHRARAIGTGELVTEVSAGTAFIPATNSIGYAFFSLGTFGGKANIKYLSLDGNDPIYANGVNTAGAFPNCTGFFNTTPAFSCGAPGLPTFANLNAGNYKAWSLIQASTATPVPATLASFIQAGQDQADPNSTPHIADLVPTQICGNPACSTKTKVLPVFKSHYGISGFTPDNGTAAGHTESGGSMAGATFTVNADQDYQNAVGVGELDNYFQ